MKAPPLLLNARRGTLEHPPKKLHSLNKVVGGDEAGRAGDRGHGCNLGRCSWRLWGVGLSGGALAFAVEAERTSAGHCRDDSHVGLFDTNFISAVSTNPANCSSVFLCLSGGKALNKSLWKWRSEMPKPIRGRSFTTGIFQALCGTRSLFSVCLKKHAASYEIISGHLRYLRTYSFWHAWLTKSSSRRLEALLRIAQCFHHQMCGWVLYLIKRLF